MQATLASIVTIRTISLVRYLCGAYGFSANLDSLFYNRLC